MNKLKKIEGKIKYFDICYAVNLKGVFRERLASVIVEIENHKLKTQIDSESKLVKKYGKRSAVQILHKIDLLKSAVNLSDLSHLPPTRLHRLFGELSGYFAIDVTKQLRLVFRGMDVAGNIIVDKEEIIHVLIREVVDYHD
ncbi:type II toxin-antitoxin system RelE/ParE family toxin [Levilactobacillus cerevisiae]|nr:type II toxin-antitoxin system RelE/ParE family toxin [Levilactobacillus cerevisiae]